MSKVAPADLVKRRGGRFACALGIDLAAPDVGERFGLSASWHSGLRPHALRLLEGWRLTDSPPPNLPTSNPLWCGERLRLRHTGA
ncbi:MAG: hypothetical protein Q7T90_05270 [Thiobacillus sp.]|nr:hypothetical protein [Thiobacillus sp.]